MALVGQEKMASLSGAVAGSSELIILAKTSRLDCLFRVDYR
jgi:hypothetical protein